MSGRILILDFGSQYTQLIARRVRECEIACEVQPCDLAPEHIQAFKPAGIILSGSHETVTQSHTPRAPEIVFKLGCPVLGICYGMQTMALQLGGQVRQGTQREGGHAKARIEADNALFKGLIGEPRPRGNSPALLDVWMSHGDEVTVAPPGFQVILSTQIARIAGMADEARRFYGLQCHPEVSQTYQGRAMLGQFVRVICGCTPNWMPQRILAERLDTIRQTVAQESVLLALSGGVDSAVLAVLLHRAIGPQLHCVFVDTGLLLNTHRALIRTLADTLQIPIKTVEAGKCFLNELAGIVDPEKKRKTIGRLFVEVFEREASALQPPARFLAQGTILSDVIESAGSEQGREQAIKSHHNVGGLPERMQLALLEPLRGLFKDEVRHLGVELGLPREVLYRHPFPGPGLAIRILGEVTAERLNWLRQADLIFQEVLHSLGLHQDLSQAFCVLLPINTVGVIGDARHYGPVIALRAVETDDFMTARWALLPPSCLEMVSSRILNEVPSVSRVVYDISSKPPATIEWE